MPGKAPSPWAKALAQGIGARVKHYREAQGMTGRALSARCIDLGLEIRPAVLSTIETGVRDSITTAELLVLARAVGVSPLSLLLPQDAATEVAPGLTLDADAARAWFVGTEPPRTITITVPAGAEVRMTS